VCHQRKHKPPHNTAPPQRTNRAADEDGHAYIVVDFLDGLQATAAEASLPDSGADAKPQQLCENEAYHPPGAMIAAETNECYRR
jgi:hypothetical protein